MSTNTLSTQKPVDLDGTTSHKESRPVRMVIHNFPKYTKDLNALPIVENIKLAVVADFIAGSFAPGSQPIVGVRLVGHADTDFQQGPKFEQQISVERAEIMKARLRNDVGIRTFAFSIVQTVPNPAVPRPSAIQWISLGVGASQPDERNVRRKKTPANMTENDRKLNRRVEIILQPGPSPVPNSDADLIARTVLDDFWKNRLPLPPPGPPPSLPGWFWHFVAPPKKDEWKRLKKAIKESLKHFDVETAIDTIKNRLLPELPREGGTTISRNSLTNWTKRGGKGRKSGGRMMTSERFADAKHRRDKLLTAIIKMFDKLNGALERRIGFDFSQEVRL